MCGICGVAAPGRPPEVEVVAAMTAALAHRGPDGTGSFSAPGIALGHRRLAVLDLGEGGRQPLLSAEGAQALVHNGEIFDYRELRSELAARGHAFRTATDTEVLLAAYREWGTECVRRFNGMWAFALWDGAAGRLLLSRDRFGIKPLFYRWAQGRLVFASELKAFRADPATPLAASPRAVRDFLEQGYLDHLPETLVEGIREVPPAHTLILDAAGLRLERYWELPGPDAPAATPQEVRNLLVDAVRLRLRSDVRVGSALSGGLDSSAVVGAVAQLRRSSPGDAVATGDRLRTFTLWFDDPALDERRHAREAAAAAGAEAHELTFDDAELLQVLPAVVACQDAPFGSPSIVGQWLVMRAAARAGVTVMLDGQGADELLLGYPLTPGYRTADLLLAGRLVAAARELAAWRRAEAAGPGRLLEGLAAPLLPEGAAWQLRARRGGAHGLVGPALAGLGPTPFATRPCTGERLRDRYRQLLLERGLPELLRYEDRNSMAHSVEARVPFLDHRLVEAAARLDTEALYRDGLGKRVLRDAAGDLLPPGVRARTDKLGFSVPTAGFLRGAAGAFAHEVLASPELAARGWVARGPALVALAAVRAGRPVDPLPVWRALSLELWARAFLDVPRPTAPQLP